MALHKRSNCRQLLHTLVIASVALCICACSLFSLYTPAQFASAAYGPPALFFEDFEDNDGKKGVILDFKAEDAPNNGGFFSCQISEERMGSANLTISNGTIEFRVKPTEASRLFFDVYYQTSYYSDAFTVRVDNSVVSPESTKIINSNGVRQQIYAIPAGDHTITIDGGNLSVFLDNIGLAGDSILSGLTPCEGSYYRGGNLSLRWPEIPSATGYRLQIAADYAFSDILVDEDMADNTQYDYSLPEEYTCMYWRLAVDIDTPLAHTVWLPTVELPVYTSVIGTDPEIEINNWLSENGALSLSSYQNDFSTSSYNEETGVFRRYLYAEEAMVFSVFTNTNYNSAKIMLDGQDEQSLYYNGYKNFLLSPGYHVVEIQSVYSVYFDIPILCKPLPTADGGFETANWEDYWTVSHPEAWQRSLDAAAIHSGSAGLRLDYSTSLTYDDTYAYFFVNLSTPQNFRFWHKVGSQFETINLYINENSYSVNSSETWTQSPAYYLNSGLSQIRIRYYDYLIEQLYFDDITFE